MVHKYKFCDVHGTSRDDVEMHGRVLFHVNIFRSSLFCDVRSIKGVSCVLF